MERTGDCFSSSFPTRERTRTGNGTFRNILIKIWQAIDSFVTFLNFIKECKCLSQDQSACHQPVKGVLTDGLRLLFVEETVIDPAALQS